MIALKRLGNSLSALKGGEGGDPLRSDGEGEVGGHPHFTPPLSAPRGGEGVPSRSVWVPAAAICMLAIFAFSALAAAPAPIAANPELLAKAKQEGSVVWYTSI